MLNTSVAGGWQTTKEKNHYGICWDGRSKHSSTLQREKVADRGSSWKPSLIMLLVLNRQDNLPPFYAFLELDAYESNMDI